MPALFASFIFPVPAGEEFSSFPYQFCGVGKAAAPAIGKNWCELLLTFFASPSVV